MGQDNCANVIPCVQEQRSDSPRDQHRRNIQQKRQSYSFRMQSPATRFGHYSNELTRNRSDKSERLINTNELEPQLIRSGDIEKDPRALLDGGGMFDDMQVLDTHGTPLTDSQRTKRSSSVYGRVTEEQIFEDTDKSSQEEFDKSISLLEICVQS